MKRSQVNRAIGLYLHHALGTKAGAPHIRAVQFAHKVGKPGLQRRLAAGEGHAGSARAGNPFHQFVGRAILVGAIAHVGP